MVKLAAAHHLESLEYERPSLEEIFLTYYGGSGAPEPGDLEARKKEGVG